MTSVVISSTPKQRLVISKQSYRRKDYYCLRIWYLKDGAFYPDRRGISVNLQQICSLGTALQVLIDDACSPMVTTKDTRLIPFTRKVRVAKNDGRDGKVVSALCFDGTANEVGNRLIVAKQEYKGNPIFSVRKWWSPEGDGLFVPTQKGLNITEEDADKLIRFIPKLTKENYKPGSLVVPCDLPEKGIVKDTSAMRVNTKAQASFPADKMDELLSSLKAITDRLSELEDHVGVKRKSNKPKAKSKETVKSATESRKLVPNRKPLKNG